MPRNVRWAVMVSALTLFVQCGDGEESVPADGGSYGTGGSGNVVAPRGSGGSRTGNRGGNTSTSGTTSPAGTANESCSTGSACTRNCQVGCNKCTCSQRKLSCVYDCSDATTSQNEVGGMQNTNGRGGDRNTGTANAGGRNTSGGRDGGRTTSGDASLDRPATDAALQSDGEVMSDSGLRDSSPNVPDVTSIPDSTVVVPDARPQDAGCAHPTAETHVCVDSCSGLHIVANGRCECESPAVDIVDCQGD